MSIGKRVGPAARALTAFIATIAFAGLIAQDAGAQKWPERAGRIVTPFAPGGGTDIFARLLAQRLTEVLGQQFVVDNRPGAGSTLGTEYVARSPADGYTLLMTSSSFSFNPGLYPKLRYDAIKDFAGVSLVVKVPHVIVVVPTSPMKTLADFVSFARAKPGQVLYASSGPGSAMHLAGALFGVVTNTQLTHVPYKGGSATATAVMSGEATTAFNTIETVMPLIHAKRLRPLAVSTRERAPALPDVPTAIESGIKDYDVSGWFGLLAPAGTPRAIIEQVSGEIAKAMAAGIIRDRALQEGAMPIGSTPAQFDTFLRDEITRWTKIINGLAIKLD